MSAQVPIFANAVPIRNGPSSAAVAERVELARREHERARRRERGVRHAPHLFDRPSCWRRALLAAAERTALARLGSIEALQAREGASDGG